MRSIDADALKEDFKSRLALCNEWIAKAKDKETKIRASAVKAFIGEVIMTIDNAPTVEVKPECEGCDYRKFTEQFIDGVVDVMTKNGISSVEELNRRLKGEES